MTAFGPCAALSKKPWRPCAKNDTIPHWVGDAKYVLCGSHRGQDPDKLRFHLDPIEMKVPFVAEVKQGDEITHIDVETYVETKPQEGNNMVSTMKIDIFPVINVVEGNIVLHGPKIAWEGANREEAANSVAFINALVGQKGWIFRSQTGRCYKVGIDGQATWKKVNVKLRPMVTTPEKFGMQLCGYCKTWNEETGRYDMGDLQTLDHIREHAEELRLIKNDEVG